MNIGDVALLVDRIHKRNKKREEEREKENDRKQHKAPDYSNFKSPYLRARMKTIQQSSQQTKQPQTSHNLTREELADLDDQLQGSK